MLEIINLLKKFDDLEGYRFRVSGDSIHIEFTISGSDETDLQNGVFEEEWKGFPPLSYHLKQIEIIYQLLKWIKSISDEKGVIIERKVVSDDYELCYEIEIPLESIKKEA